MSSRAEDCIAGAINGYIYSASVPASRPTWHFTPRVMAYHAEVLTPMESGLVLWQR
jgi:starch phosphorylase